MAHAQRQVAQAVVVVLVVQLLVQPVQAVLLVQDSCMQVAMVVSVSYLALSDMQAAAVAARVALVPEQQVHQTARAVV